MEKAQPGSSCHKEAPGWRLEGSGLINNFSANDKTIPEKEKISRQPELRVARDGGLCLCFLASSLKPLVVHIKRTITILLPDTA